MRAAVVSWMLSSCRTMLRCRSSSKLTAGALLLLDISARAYTYTTQQSHSNDTIRYDEDLHWKTDEQAVSLIYYINCKRTENVLDENKMIQTEMEVCYVKHNKIQKQVVTKKLEA